MTYTTSLPGWKAVKLPTLRTTGMNGNRELRALRPTAQPKPATRHEATLLVQNRHPAGQFLPDCRFIPVRMRSEGNTHKLPRGTEENGDALLQGI